MGPLLLDDIWKRRGISLLWDADALNSVCAPTQVINLRQFLRLHVAGWQGVDDVLVNHDKCLVVSGLESAIDALRPAEAEVWLSEVVYQAMVSYQQIVADGANEAALLLWLADAKRLVYQTSDDVFHWHCGTEYKGQQIPLSRCLFNGGQSDLRRIQAFGGSPLDDGIGLFHPRICS
jgi:hypothetical protein